MKDDKLNMKNKLQIISIKYVYNQNSEKTYYINVIINDSKSFKSKEFTFNSNNFADISQIFDLEGMLDMETIKFHMYDLSSNIIPVYLGETTKVERSKENNNDIFYKCNLVNSSFEKAVEIKYAYNLEPDLIKVYDREYNELKKGTSRGKNS